MKHKSRTLNIGIFADPIERLNKDKKEIFEIPFIRLYLYVKPESLIPLLSSKRIHLSMPWNTNDVTECVQQNKEKQSELIKEYGYICLSCRCDSSAMWGYYANSSKGACLAFDIPVEKIKRGQYKLIDDDYTVQNTSKIIRAVEYKENRVRGDNTLSLLHRKALEWSHEEEYRIAIPLEQSKREPSKDYTHIYFYDDILFKYISHVILGVHSHHECSNIKAILQALDIKNVNVTRASFSSQSFSYLIPDTIYSLEQHFVSGDYSYIIDRKKEDWSPVNIESPARQTNIASNYLSEMESLAGCSISKNKLAYTNITQFKQYNPYQMYFVAAECKSADNKISYECFIIDKNTIKKITGFTSTAKNKLRGILEHLYPPTPLPTPRK